MSRVSSSSVEMKDNGVDQCDTQNGVSLHVGSPHLIHSSDNDDDIIREFRFDPTYDRSTDINLRTFATCSPIPEIVELAEEDGDQIMSSSHNHGEGGNTMQSTSLFSIDINNLRSSGSSDVNAVYVAVGKSESSSDALLWALNNDIFPGNTLVYLVHIFPDIKYIPSPMGGGWVLKSQVNRELVEIYEAQESSKRRELLTKYVDKCTTHLVQVETILIESESIPKALVELVSVLNIPKLIVGISKSKLKKMRAGKWNGSIVADEVLQSIPAGCEVKIICEGKDIMSSQLLEQSLSPTTVARSDEQQQQQQQRHPASINSFSCCFRASPNND